MYAIHKVGLASAVALSALTFAVTAGSAAETVPQKHPAQNFCLEYEKGGVDCSFTSYAQCQESASGINAECFSNVFHRDDSAI